MSSTPATTPPPRRTTAALVAMIVASAAYPLSVVLWLLVMIAVVMGLSDNPPHVGLATLTLGVYFAYPLTVLAALIAGWVLYGLRRSRGAVWAALAPLAHLVLIVLMIVGMMVTAGAAPH